MTKSFAQEKAEFDAKFKELYVRLVTESQKKIDRRKLLEAVVMKGFDNVTLADVI